MSSPLPPSDVAKPLTWATNCCGCCCDMRTSVIVVNLISIGMAVVSGSLLLVAGHAASSLTFDDDTLYDGIDDEAALQEMQEYLDEIQGTATNTWIPIFATVLAIRIVANSLGVYGAMKYKVWPVVVSLVGYGMEIICSIYMLNVIGLIVSTFFAYPHCFFMRELNDKQSVGDDASEYKIHTDAASKAKGTPAAIV